MFRAGVLLRSDGGTLSALAGTERETMKDCICDEMLEKMRYGPSYARTDKKMALSWECPLHGKITADYRDVEHIHPPAPPIRVVTTGPAPKLSNRPRGTAGGS